MTNVEMQELSALQDNLNNRTSLSIAQANAQPIFRLGVFYAYFCGYSA